ncbi:MAG: hypothetical protein LC623_02250 [Halobacteriales archaeon]|nr:hypothetical protein [Halobacteriales archaeon]
MERELRALHELARTHESLLRGTGPASLGFLTGAAYVLATGFERADYADGLRHAFEASRRHALRGAEATAFERGALTAIMELLSSYRGAA